MQSIRTVESARVSCRNVAENAMDRVENNINIIETIIENNMRAHGKSSISMEEKRKIILGNKIACGLLAKVLYYYKVANNALCTFMEMDDKLAGIQDIETMDDKSFDRLLTTIETMRNRNETGADRLTELHDGISTSDNIPILNSGNDVASMINDFLGVSNTDSVNGMVFPSVPGSHTISESDRVQRNARPGSIVQTN